MGSSLSTLSAARLDIYTIGACPCQRLRYTVTHRCRIWAAIKRESLLVAAEGIATPEEVDKIFKCVLKTRLGPFEQMDVSLIKFQSGENCH